MVKIERLQEWAASDKCLSVMGKRLLFYEIYTKFVLQTQHHYILFENGSISY